MLEVGDRIRMTGEVQRYTVMACNDRYAILTKPFNAKRTYLYSIVDLKEGIRGPCNYIFGLPVEDELTTFEGAREALQMLESGEMSVSRRRYKDLTKAELEQLHGKI